MERVFVGLAIVALSCVLLVGCGEKEGKQDVQTGPTTAIEFQDGQYAYYDMQSSCPVCDGTPIKQEFHVDTDKGRIYFDKKECVDKFNADKQQYLKKFGEQIRQDMSGAGSAQ